MTLLILVYLLHALSTVMLAGLIWFVQVVHYPLMGIVGEIEFERYEKAHMRRTTWVVAPLMLTEVASAAALLFIVEIGPPRILAIAGLVLVVLIWVSTAALQVPCHERLRRGFNAQTAARLVSTNWIRTLAWTARAVIALAILPLDQAT